MHRWGFFLPDFPSFQCTISKVVHRHQFNFQNNPSCRLYSMTHYYKVFNLDGALVLVVKGGDLKSEGRELESQHQILD